MTFEITQKKKSKLISYEWLIFILLIALSILLAFGKGYSYAVTEGLRLWIACVLPALFPYFFITAVLSSLGVTDKIGTAAAPITKRLFNCGGITGYAFFMSLISGYPVGAKMVSDMKLNGLISDSESVRAAAFCSTSSPMFLIASVGNLMFKSPLFGLLLFISNVVSAILVGVIFSFYKRKEQPSEKIAPAAKNTDNVLYESVYSAVISVLVVGGLITIFYLLTEILSSLNVLTPFSNILSQIFSSEAKGNATCYGFFECTRGLKILAQEKISLFTLPIAAAMCSFGGLSVIMQSVAYLKKAKIKTALFLLSKILSAAFGFLSGLLLSAVFL